MNLGASLKIRCAVLEPKSPGEPPQRVISEAEFMKALGMYRSGALSTRRETDEAGAQIPLSLSYKNIKPLVLRHLGSVHYQPMKVLFLNGSVGWGIPADVIPKICEIWMDARREIQLGPTQIKIADMAETILRGLAHVGIVALVDEATGYQEVRDRKALQEVLKLYIDGKRYEWTKTFPLVFFKEISRLKKWPWNDGKMPSVTGKYINDLVYDRLTPGALEELEKLNPVGASGRRKHYHHQFLTRDIGHPELTQRLYELIGMARMSADWEQFVMAVKRTFPKPNENPELPLEM